MSRRHSKPNDKRRFYHSFNFRFTFSLDSPDRLTLTRGILKSRAGMAATSAGEIVSSNKRLWLDLRRSGFFDPITADDECCASRINIQPGAGTHPFPRYSKGD
jgi:hypothetical protein